MFITVITIYNNSFSWKNRATWLVKHYIKLLQEPHYTCYVSILSLVININSNVLHIFAVTHFYHLYL